LQGSLRMPSLDAKTYPDYECQPQARKQIQFIHERKLDLFARASHPADERNVPIGFSSGLTQGWPLGSRMTRRD
jgi:hypothetical protein